MDMQKIPEISLAITGVQFSSRTVFEGTNLFPLSNLAPTHSVYSRIQSLDNFITDGSVTIEFSSVQMHNNLSKR